MSKVVWFFLGVGVGGFAGIFLASKKIEQAYNEKLEDELEGQREYFKHKYEKKEQKKEEEVEAPPKELSKASYSDYIQNE